MDVSILGILQTGSTANQTNFFSTGSDGSFLGIKRRQRESEHSSLSSAVFT
jgi:hypothetical protein